MKRHHIVLFLLVLALLACATACGPTLIAVPSSLRPTAPPDAPRLLVRLNIGTNQFGIGRHTADYLTDGTIIRWTVVGSVCQLAQPCGTMERNTLTATGLATLRALLDKDADLLANPMTVTPQRSPGIDLRGGYRVDTFVLERPDGTRYAVNAPSTSWRNQDPMVPDPATWVRDPAIERLNDLAEGLVDPVTVVGSAGLARSAWEAYEPPDAAVFIKFDQYAFDPHPTPIVGKDGTVVGFPFVPPDFPDMSQVDWPFEGTPETFGMAFDASSTPWTTNAGATYRCAFLRSVDALAAIASLPRSIGTSLAPGDVASGVTWGSSPLRLNPKTSFSLQAVALLPADTAVSCVEALSY